MKSSCTAASSRPLSRKTTWSCTRAILYDVALGVDRDPEYGRYRELVLPGGVLQGTFMGHLFDIFVGLVWLG
jgi:hypothetical protein